MLTQITYFYKINIFSKTNKELVKSVALFYIFINLTNVWIKRRQLILITVPTFNLLQYFISFSLRKTPFMGE